jgi:ribonuclease P protein subunit RPR2
MTYKFQNKKIQKKISKIRINKLFTIAELRALSGNLNLADRYVKIARKISMRHKVTISKENKLRICKHCYCYLLPDSNCRIRIHRGKLIVFCFSCNKYTRHPLKSK